MNLATLLDKENEDSNLCDLLVKSAAVSYSQFGNIAKNVYKRELGLIGNTSFCENTERQVLSLDAGALKRVRYDVKQKKISINDPPEQPFDNLPAEVFLQWRRPLRPSTREPAPPIIVYPGDENSENVTFVLHHDEPIRVQVSDDEPYYDVITLESNGNLVCSNTLSNNRVSHKLTNGKFKCDLNWNIYGEDFYIFIQTTENYGHSLIVYSYYPLRCKYKMAVPILQNVRHISLHKDILKCSLCNRTEFYYLKDLLKHPISQRSQKYYSEDATIEFTIPNLAEPFFSLNFSSFNTEVKLISSRFLSITFPYQVKTVCFRDLYLARKNIPNSCPNTFYSYDQLYIPEDGYNRFYVAKENKITCHKFCLQNFEKTQIEVIWSFNIYGPTCVHPLFRISKSWENNRIFTEKVGELSKGKDFKFLSLFGFDHYILAACHFLISPQSGLYRYRDFLYLLDILTGKVLAISCLPADSNRMGNLRNLTDDVLFSQDIDLIRLGGPQKPIGKNLWFHTGTTQRGDYWETEQGKKEAEKLLHFRRLSQML